MLICKVGAMVAFQQQGGPWLEQSEGRELGGGGSVRDGRLYKEPVH